jgi:molecular chaperone GrpE
MATLARFDLKPFAALGEPFDPNRHEAVSELASEQVPAQHVLHQVRGGYLLGNRLLRPARVVISSGTAAPAAPPAAGPVCDEAAESAAT